MAAESGRRPPPTAIAPRAAPTVHVDGFALPGTRPLGCLLVHGFTGTPDEMRPLGLALSARGFPVHAVRLAGHGTDIDDLAGTRWQDWLASVDEAVAELQGIAPRVAVVGMSMGALLALHLAAARPRAVGALVLCGTPLRLHDWRLRVVPLLRRIPPLARRYAVLPKENRGPDVADPVVRAASPSYRATPLAGIVELLRLQAVVRRELEQVTQPVLALHGRHDHTVPLTNLGVLRRRLGSRTVETRVLENSWHVITIDHDRDEVARLAGDFLERIEGGGVV